MRRLLAHLLYPRWRLRRSFPPVTLAAIESAIRSAESLHGGEIRFAIETCLHLGRLRHPEAGRRRAEELFARLRVWDTAANNGVLIYVLLAEQEIHVVADRGFDGVVSPAEWRSVCDAMQARFREGAWAAGSLAGIEAVSALIARHFPPGSDAGNELPDAPVVLP